MASPPIESYLSQLARLLFNAAAEKWYAAAIIEFVAGFGGIALSLTNPSGKLGLGLVAVDVFVLIVAYSLRLLGEDQHETAETMRRQSVFAEGLGWSVSTWQMDQWRQRVGKRIRKQAENQPRPSDYYATQVNQGPSRLLEMTVESAFYTYHLYCRIRMWLGGALIGAFVLLMGLSVISVYLSAHASELTSRILYAAVPVVITLDLVGWWLRLGRRITSLDRLQQGFEHLRQDNQVNAEQVLRLVAEYDNTVTSGIPILNWLFNRWHNEIASLWQKRKDDS